MTRRVALAAILLGSLSVASAPAMQRSDFRFAGKVVRSAAGR